MGLAKKFTAAWTALKEEVLYEAPSRPPTSHAQGPLHAPDLLETATTIQHALSGLHTQQSQMHQHVETLAQMEGTTPDHQATIAALRRTLREMATALAQAHAAQSQLAQTLRDKNQLLSTRTQTLTQAAEHETMLRHTVGQLQEGKAQQAEALTRLQATVTALRADLRQSQEASQTLTQQHDELVGKYHQLFLAFQKMEKVSGHTSAAPAA